MEVLNATPDIIPFDHRFRSDIDIAMGKLPGYGIGQALLTYTGRPQVRFSTGTVVLPDIHALGDGALAWCQQRSVHMIKELQQTHPDYQYYLMTGFYHPFFVNINRPNSHYWIVASETKLTLFQLLSTDGLTDTPSLIIDPSLYSVSPPENLRYQPQLPPQEHTCPTVKDFRFGFDAYVPLQLCDDGIVSMKWHQLADDAVGISVYLSNEHVRSQPIGSFVRKQNTISAEISKRLPRYLESTLPRLLSATEYR